ncbi:LptF/LptG family permease [Compostibacter hankyongensis]
MKKIDWYILKKFLGTFFYAILIFVVISVVIDITEKIDDFISSHQSVYQIIFNYYLGFIPHIAALLFPLFIFIAVIFFTSKMAYRSEIIAILGSGASFNRLLRAYWVGSILLALLLGVANQSWIPRANQIRTAFEDKYIDNPTQKKDVLVNIHMRIDPETYISINSYYPGDHYASGVTIETIKGRQLIDRLESQYLRWDTAAKAWRSSSAIYRRLGTLRQQVNVARDTLLKLPLTPDDLVQQNSDMTAMTTPQLNRIIARQEMRGSEGINFLYVEKYRRTASAVSVIILAFIGAVIASRKVRGGSGLHLALGIVISASYILFMQFSTTFSVKGTLNPLLAVWIPNIFFAGVAYALYRKAPK